MVSLWALLLVVVGISAQAQGADAFFPKPSSPSAVRRKLEQLLC